MIPALHRFPEAVALLSDMAAQFSPDDYLDAIWRLRQGEMDLRDAQRARVRDVIGARAIPDPEQRKPSEPIKLRLVAAE